MSLKDFLLTISALAYGILKVHWRISSKLTVEASTAG
jgi:hypothetical protein